MPVSIDRADFVALQARAVETAATSTPTPFAVRELPPGVDLADTARPGLGVVLRFPTRTPTSSATSSPPPEAGS